MKDRNDTTARQTYLQQTDRMDDRKKTNQTDTDKQTDRTDDRKARPDRQRPTRVLIRDLNFCLRLHTLNGLAILYPRV